VGDGPATPDFVSLSNSVWEGCAMFIDSTFHFDRRSFSEPLTLRVSVFSGEESK